MRSLRIIFLGPPGVGKGTQATLLAESGGVPHISTGDMFRRAIQQQTPMGRKALPYVESGRYVPDPIVNGLVEERLSEADCERGFILDGYPRTTGQAEAFEDFLSRQGIQLDAVIYLTLPEQVLLNRLTGRRVCQQCGATYHINHQPPRQEGVCDNCGGKLVQRDDDTVETVKKRLAVYQEETTPLLNFYRQRGLLLEIDGDGSVEEVRDRIAEKLAEKRAP